MSIVKEEGGRLNAFAKEPRIELINEGERKSKGSLIFILGGTVLVLGLIAISVTIS